MIESAPALLSAIRVRAAMLAGLLLAAIGVAALAAAGFAAAPYASAAATATTAGQAVEVMVPTLGRAQSAGDEITNAGLVEAADIDPASARLLAVHTETPFWVARGQSGDVCVLYAMSGGEHTGFSCGSPHTLETQGLAIATLANQTGQYTEAYLVPAELSTAIAEAGLGLDNPAAGLFTRFHSVPEAAGRVTQIPRDSPGEPAFPFRELDTRG